MASIGWKYPEADLFVLCGCPADSVKHLMKLGLIVEREKNGVMAQTGPNAILLSDTMIQKGSFSNLAEFPVLQMLYLQGMILPDHPNNTGRKPMLIGLEDQVRSQSSYIYRGTYGLASLAEIMESGVPEALAIDMLRIKRWFAFDNIRRTEDLLDLRIVDAPAVELRNGAFVRRTGFNRYEFIHGGSSLTVDLNLGDTRRVSAHVSARLSYTAAPLFLRRAHRRRGWMGRHPSVHGEHRMLPGSDLSHRRRARHRAFPDGFGHQHQRGGGHLPYAWPRRSLRRPHVTRSLRSPHRLLRHATGAGERREEIRGPHRSQRSHLLPVLRAA